VPAPVPPKSTPAASVTTTANTVTTAALATPTIAGIVNQPVILSKGKQHNESYDFYYNKDDEDKNTFIESKQQIGKSEITWLPINATVTQNMTTIINGMIKTYNLDLTNTFIEKHGDTIEVKVTDNQDNNPLKLSSN
jgi:hypothetical protein